MRRAALPPEPSNGSAVKESVRDSHDRGDTLIEVLLALVVLSLAALALIIAFSTTISASGKHRMIASANIVMASASQQALSQIEANPNLFDCNLVFPTTTTQPQAYLASSVAFSIPANYGSFQASISAVQYWQASSSQFVSTCQTGEAPEDITVEVMGHGITLYNSFVVNLPSGNSISLTDTSTGVAAQIVFSGLSGESATGEPGETFSPQPVVSVLDQYNQIVASDLAPVQLSVEGSPAGVVISGCTSNDLNGEATFSGCIISGPVGTYTLAASLVGQTFADGDPFTSDPSGTGLNANSINGAGSFWNSSPTFYTTTFSVTISGSPDQLVFASGPSMTSSGTQWTGPLSIDVDNSAGHLITSLSSGDVSITISGGWLDGCEFSDGTPVESVGGNTTLMVGDTIQIPVSSGVATLKDCTFYGAIFYNLTASPAGSDPTSYTMGATYPSAVSASKTVSVTGPGPAYQLAFTTQPSGVSSASPTTAFPSPVVVTVEDQFGNPDYNLTTANVLTHPNSFVLSFAKTYSPSETLSGCSYSMATDTGEVSVANCQGSNYEGNLQLVATYVSGGVTLVSPWSSDFSITGAVESLVFTTQPVAGASGSVLSTQPVITLYDGSSPPLVVTGATQQVNLTPVASPPGTLTGLSGCSNNVPNFGVVDFQTCSFVGQVGTSYTLTATLVNSLGQTITATSQPISPTNAGAATQLVFTTAPIAGVAGSLLTTQPVVSVEDTAGNVVTSSSITISLGTSGGVLSGYTGLNAVAGVVDVANCTFGGLVDVGYSMSASSSGLATGYATIWSTAPGPVSASNSTVVAYPTSVVDDGTTSSTITATMSDAYGNAIAGEDVTLGSNSTTSQITTVNGVTGTNGQAIFSVTDTVPESVMYTATDTTSVGVLGSTATVIFTGPVSATMSSVVAAPTTGVTANGVANSTVTVSLFDANGSPVPNQTVTLSSSSLTSTVTTVIGVTNAAGQAIFTVTDTTAETVIYTATDQTPALPVTVVQTASVGFVAGPAAQVVLSGCSTPLTSGSSCTLSATMEDANGNVVTSYHGTAPVMSQSGTGSVTLSGATTFTNGVATVSAKGLKAGAAAVKAAASGFTSAADNITVIPGTATQLILSGCSTPLASGTSCTLSATLEDANGNTESTYTGVAPVMAQTGTGSVTFSGATTFTNGVATVSATGILTGSAAVKATADSFTSAADTITVIPGTATQLILSGCPASLVSGTSCTLTATLEDVNNNVLTTYSGAAPTMAFTGTGSVAFSGATTFTKGVATVSVKGILVGSPAVKATADGVTSAADTINVTIGAPTQLILSGCPASLVSGTSCTLTVTLEDVSGNVETSYTGAAPAMAFTGTGSVTFSGATTFTNGVATVSVTGVLAGSPAVKAIADGVTSAADTITVTPGAATQVVLSGCPASLVSGTSCTLSVTIEDANGNTVTSYTGAAPAMAQTGTGSVSFSGATTFTKGVATVSVTGILVGSPAVKATADGFTSAADTINVTIGAPTQLILSGCPASLVSGTSCTLTATLEDVSGNVETSYTGGAPTMAFTGTGSVTFSGATTFTSGVATVSVKGILVGSPAVKATADGVTSAADTITVTLGAATQVVLSGCTASLASGSSCTLTATIEDASGNTETSYTGTAPVMAQTGTGSVTFSGATTFINGVATVSVKGVLAGSPAVKATADGFTSAADTITVSPGAATQVVLSGCPASLVSGASCTLTMTLKDASGNVLTTYGGAGTTPAMTQTGTGSVTFSGATTFTNGVGTVSVTGLATGNPVVKATADGVSATQSIAVTIGTATQLVLSGCSASLVSGMPCALTITLEDASGNVETAYNGAAPTLTQTGTGTVSFVNAPAFTNGVTTGSVSAVLTGGVTIKAVADGLSATDLITVTPGPASQVILSGCPASLVSGASCTLTMTLKDANGNILTTYGGAGTTPAMTQTGTGSVTFSGATTFTSGVATVSVTGLKTGSDVVKATADGVSATQSIAVTTGAATQLVVTVATGQSHTSFTVVVTEEDAAGNTVTSDSASTVTISRSSGNGSFGPPTSITETLTNGVATFTGCKWSTRGNNEVLAASGSSVTGNFMSLTFGLS